MKLPQTGKTRTALAVGIAATCALLIIGPGSTTATAGRLIGSAAIKNNSVRSIDIHNGTVTGLDVKDGSLTAKDFSGAMRGATGPTGKTGLRGPAGGGGRSSETITSWQAHYVATTNSYATITSTQKIPAGTQVEAVQLSDPTGDWSACNYSSITVQDEFGATSLGQLHRSNTAWSPFSLPGGGVTTTRPTSLVIYASCGMGTGAAVPSFDMTLTLALTTRDTTATSTFD